ncbi:MAG TPA: thioredoxin family protein [Nitrososphaera sp.]|nr:thioredoxin family protein [Nitrososphaera sp.]
MNRDNASALAVGVAVVTLIAGFGFYFNNPALNDKAPGGLAGTAAVTAGAGSSGNNTTTTALIASSSSTATKPHVDKSQFRQAPELAGISNYINSPQPFKLSDLKGKVVLVDFWTYSCINCIRTIPYLNAWYEKYADQGFVIVGVHSPEFDFEKDPANVQAAVEKFGIKYPVVQDNDHATWNAYQNRYWPHKYLIDDQGFIRYDHIGEGGYADTEKVIQSLLQERRADLGQNATAAINNSTTSSTTVNPEGAQSVNFGMINTPELYFGYNYARSNLGNPEGFDPGKVVTYSLPDDKNNNNDNDSIKPNAIYLSGDWLNAPDSMELKSHTGKIVLEYSAKSVNIVAGGTGKLQVSEDGHAVAAADRGADVNSDGTADISGQRLYNLVMHGGYGDHKIVIDVTGEGFKIYTFTFG